MVKDACTPIEQGGRAGLYKYLFPFHDQAKETIWEGTFSDGSMRFLDMIPENLIVGDPNKSEMKIYLTNGNIIHIGGSDNLAALRGPNPIYVVLSEFGYHYPDVWKTLRPILRANKGKAVFNSTATDAQHFTDMMAWSKSHSQTWYYQNVTIDDTYDHTGHHIISSADLEEDRADGKDEGWINQEYYNSTLGTIEGAYWGDLLEQAEKQGRIGKVPYNPALPMEISFDLGRNMETALWFRQSTRTAFNYVDYYENRDKDLTHYFEIIRQKKYNNIHFIFPHDIMVTDLTGLDKSRLQIAIDSGATKHTVLENKGAGYLQMGIEAVRRMLPMCYFDAEKCKTGLDHLKNYKKKYDAKRRTYRNTPALSWHNNGADSLRYSAVYADFPSAKSDLTAQRQEGLDEFRRLNRM